MKKWCTNLLSFRNRVVVIVVGISLGAMSLLYTNDMARRLREKRAARRGAMGSRHGTHQPRRAGRQHLPGPAAARHHVQRQQHPVHHHRREPPGGALAPHPRPDHRTPGPAARTDRPLHRGEHPHSGQGALVGAALPHHLLRQVGVKLKSFTTSPTSRYSSSRAFIALGFIAFRSSKHDEQNRVWIGLAKETAHQLGTPTSSLLGWIEYLRARPWTSRPWTKCRRTSRT